MLVALCYLLAGLVAVVAAVTGLAGPWWGLLTCGAALLALAVLESRGAQLPAPVPAGDPEEAR